MTPPNVNAPPARPGYSRRVHLNAAEVGLLWRFSHRTAHKHRYRTAFLAHPGGNITGVRILANELDGKWLQILLELLRCTHRVAVLAGADTATPESLEALRSAGAEFRV